VSYLDDIARTPTEPRFRTLAEAQRVFPELSLDEYTLARVINSEHGCGSPTEMTAIGDADVNKAAATGRSIYQHATAGAGYGAQGDAGRPVSTARAPGPRHVAAALAVLRGPARGISRGARRYLDPRTQLKLSQENISKWCPPLSVLAKWSFGADWNPRRCEVAKPGPQRNWEEWVGPIDGVDPYELMLLRPATEEHTRRYAEAVEVVRSRGGYRPTYRQDENSGGAIFAAAGLLALGAAGVYFLRTKRIWT
jgi:hypothetical protein